LFASVVDKAKVKWKTLKDTYSQRKKKEIELKQSGSAAKRKPKWRFFYQMQFLDKFQDDKPYVNVFCYSSSQE